MATPKIRPIRVHGNVAYIALTQGHEAIIDAADAPLVDGYNWYARPHLNTVYAQRSASIDSTGKKGTVILHRAIMNAPIGLLVDHIDGDGLNNRRNNLRLATHAQNQHNQRLHSNSASGVKGVFWHMSAKKWQAQIQVGGRVRHLGLFVTLDEAAAAYAHASKALHGEFGRTS